MVTGGAAAASFSSSTDTSSSSSNTAPPVPPGDAAAPDMSTQARDSWYTFNESRLEEVMAAKAWSQDPRYFKKVRLSPSAAMKMLMHACGGVEKGMKAPGGKPVEVMGLMIGRPDVESLDTLVVTDVFPLPVEGAETRVLADDTEVQNYMITLGESLEMTRKERFMGWYHSHPFSVEVHSNCFLSSTDVQTQLAWQRFTDAKDCPWLAIVVDPLRSLAKNKPEFGAYRVYPPEYTAPANQTPDGKLITDDTARVERWGSCWNRYYELGVEYFMSSLALDLLSTLTRNYLWMTPLTTTPQLESENTEQLSERIVTVAEKLEQCSCSYHPHPSMLGLVVGTGEDKNAGGGGGGGGKGEKGAMANATRSSCEIALEQCQGQQSQLAKHVVMNQL